MDKSSNENHNAELLYTMFTSTFNALKRCGNILRLHRDDVTASPLYSKSEEAWKLIQEVYDLSPSELENLKVYALVLGAGRPCYLKEGPDEKTEG
ncbi:MAG: hypothetical protein NC489_08835 [Ruminococcus flavefaciens]|nr:hypothetical protein [Ruminococcus flavefaciens]